MARTRFDRSDVDAVIDVPNSAVALGLATMVKDKNKVAMFTGPGTAALTGKATTPKIGTKFTIITKANLTSPQSQAAIYKTSC